MDQPRSDCASRARERAALGDGFPAVIYKTSMQQIFHLLVVYVANLIYLLRSSVTAASSGIIGELAAVYPVACQAAGPSGMFVSRFSCLARAAMRFKASPMGKLK